MNALVSYITVHLGRSALTPWGASCVSLIITVRLALLQASPLAFAKVLYFLFYGFVLHVCCVIA